ncbi:MAG: TPM domain-containing protein [Pseudomonadales bacterium]|nr:TPM domain-containing protein [Pseudomonadales bacterium]
MTTPKFKLLSLSNFILLSLFLIVIALVFSSWQKEKPLALVKDDAKLLINESTNHTDLLLNYIEFMRKEFDIDLRVYTSNDLTSINLSANQRFNDDKIGSKSKTQKGILVLVNPALNKVRVEISYQLEEVFTDVFVAYIEQQQMVPFFRDNRIAVGILATIELMVTRAQHAYVGKEEVYQPWLEGSGGAGAVTDANIKLKSISKASALPLEIQQQIDLLGPSHTPADVLNIEHQMTILGISTWDLPIFTEATRKIWRDRKATTAQNNNEIRINKMCGESITLIDQSSRFAVVRHKAYQRLCMPRFLRKEQGIWRLDDIVIANGLRNDFHNQWYIESPYSDNYFIRPFLFAFPDWYKSKKTGKFYKYRWGVSSTSKAGPDFKRIPCAKDFYISAVTEKLPADNIGLQVGDMPIEFFGHSIKNRCHFMKLLRKPKHNELVEIKLKRKGRIVSLSGLAPKHSGSMKGAPEPNYNQTLAIWLSYIDPEGEMVNDEWELPTLLYNRNQAGVNNGRRVF